MYIYIHDVARLAFTINNLSPLIRMSIVWQSWTRTAWKHRFEAHSEREFQA